MEEVLTELFRIRKRKEAREITLFRRNIRSTKMKKNRKADLHKLLEIFMARGCKYLSAVELRGSVQVSHFSLVKTL